MINRDHKFEQEAKEYTKGILWAPDSFTIIDAYIAGRKATFEEMRKEIDDTKSSWEYEHNRADDAVEELIEVYAQVDAKDKEILELKQTLEWRNQDVQSIIKFRDERLEAKDQEIERIKKATGWNSSKLWEASNNGLMKELEAKDIVHAADVAELRQLKFERDLAIESALAVKATFEAKDKEIEQLKKDVYNATPPRDRYADY